MRYADFPTLVDALDYAALSSAGMNFYDRRCQLEDQLEYQTLKARAEAGAKRLLSLNLKKGDRVALIAETSSEFVEAFFACQYAGLVAVGDSNGRWSAGFLERQIAGFTGKLPARSHYHW